jgi:UDP-N-acetyl-2-amino-2-deoxyglucuronate dehydrogenase
MAAGGKKIRFGVIGAAGLIGNSHIKAIQENPDLAELVAISDVNETRLQTLAQELGVKAYKSYKDLVADKNVDAVTIGTPHPLHPEQALAAMSKGKHVLTEKAMAGRLSQAQKMVATAKAKGLKLGVCFQHRLSPKTLKAVELIKAGKIGRILRVVCEDTAYKSEFYYDSGAWRGTWSGEEGGVLVNQAPHPIDILMKLAGMPRRITAVCRAQIHDNIEVEDIASALLEYPNGAQGIVHFNTTTVPRVNRTEVYGTHGALSITPEGMKFWRIEPSIDKQVKEYKGPNIYEGPKTVEEQLTFTEPRQGHPAIVENFCKAILSDEPLVCPGEEGLWSLEFANALVMSSYTGKVVDLPLDAGAYDRLMKKLQASGKAAAHRPLQPSPLAPRKPARQQPGT